MPEIAQRLKDKATAHAHALVSELTHRVPVLGKSLIDTDVPGYVPVRWHVMRGRSSELADHVSFTRSRESGAVPSTYRYAGILAIDREKLDALRGDVGGMHAVAYDLGTAAMVGVSDEGINFTTDPEDENRYMLAMRVGKGVLRASAGLWLAEQKRLVVPEDSLVYVDRLPLEDVPPGISVY